MTILSIDGGTTNTRLVLVRDGEILAAEKCGLGARNAVLDASLSYADVLTEKLRAFLAKTQIMPQLAVASGMICSEAGLAVTPYIQPPASADKLAEHAVKFTLPQLPELPLWLVPGLRTAGNVDDPMATDIMRGEEAELLGLCGKIGDMSRAVILLPGSHLKTVFLNADGVAEDFRTSLSGELLRAVAENTILREKLMGVYPKMPDRDRLLAGCTCAAERGVNEALFKVRIRQKFCMDTPEQLFAFLLGAVLCADVERLRRDGRGRRILVGGSNPLRFAYAFLLREHAGLAAEEIPEAISEYAAAYGAEQIALALEKRKNG